ncbi:MAG: hypothetical protein A3I75_06225 [Deltaproteobacteria bacterium RIFCSPLOWO2_02_FULL_50_16]|nr:MAG: hypothetical protein A2053_06625 [Deltaproteobacteria bacterium GWA2_50_8]OGQ30881.1 MAG: hypothetical protein A3B79_01405 [Deltaproteobacteria bacterium RIFCSPHIGHO2_02_FULL_50_15]OGQ56541.1 MAG: hypothetical protein A3I75_06225 [Deltaproteobacteria bacterium RIFCSPLOWO2_02_FULL_50_16]OGQ65890.1 MAG: hypothetical protein A3F89_02555 [Deltaproteobacteria bacterium RIFCSPLOWO2_12_FULL_50_11]
MKKILVLIFFSFFLPLTIHGEAANSTYLGAFFNQTFYGCLGDLDEGICDISFERFSPGGGLKLGHRFYRWSFKANYTYNHSTNDGSNTTINGIHMNSIDLFTAVHFKREPRMLDPYFEFGLGFFWLNQIFGTSMANLGFGIDIHVSPHWSIDLEMPIKLLPVTFGAQEQSDVFTNIGFSLGTSYHF